ncbi:McrB family protein [Dialister sp.]|uniref:McrB family protein n=1 Tax=Dialister sp. TaxID=1955814 RepID=UPI003F0AF888
MGNYNSNYGSSDSSFFALRQADGKVLGRVRPGVKLSTPQPGVKDYRFFVDPLSPLPKGFEESEKHGFTGFMSRIGCGYNAFANEADALNYLKTVFGDAFVTFTPAIRNNKFFVLDDMQLEGRTPFMDVDTHFYPIPAFGTVDQPPFSGDINKFCSHILNGKPLPGLSKKYWNNDIQPRVIMAATRNFEGKIGPWVVFAPLYDDAFDSTVIGEGGAYFHVKNNGPLGYGVVDFKNSELFSHILRCTHSPLWFVPEEFIPDFRLKLKPVPADGDLLADSGVLVNPFSSQDSIILSEEGNSLEGKKFREEDMEELIRSLTSKEEKKPVNDGEEEITSEEKERPLDEAGFLERLSEAAERSGLLYAEEDLINFHISLKSSRLTILAGMSGTGKSGLVRLYGRALGLPEEQVRFLAVRPSWMDDGDILGYVDVKNMVYRSADTGLAEFLAEAAAHPEKMYLICFDEMNLARAEHYFAQFISVLEKEENPVICLYNPSLKGKLYNGESYPAEIPVGRNVLFTGTVNVDESTYHFSDKILDRANVITLHQGKFRDLLQLGKKEKIDYPEIPSSLFESFCHADGLGLSEEELDLLDALNDAFRKSGIQCGIGFRVACQMGRYLENIPEGLSFNREEGLDAQVVQRILTKLRGSSQQLSTLVSTNDKGELTGSLLDVLNRFHGLSPFTSARSVLEEKARELKLYDYTI